jgi:L-alanine-DL-glutamate epimerase-like enolase superfamily enzyme
MTELGSAIPIRHVGVNAYTIPTDAPESDGTLTWDSTTLVLVRLNAGGVRGIGYSYADAATAPLVRDKLAPLLHGRDVLATSARWREMVDAIRNLGRPGMASMAIAAVDVALWDAKAKLRDISLAALLGSARSRIPVYGSGGFTSYSNERLRQQLGSRADSGMRKVKMKIGRQPDLDRGRMQAARSAIGNTTELFVDANGALSRKEARAFANEFAVLGVTWFEEPVSSDDLDGLRLLRDRAPGGMMITAGGYGYDLPYFRRMLDAGAVDVLQADATRCAGITGFLGAAALCEAYGRCRVIALPRCTCPCAARRNRRFTSNTFTITRVSNTCCSMAHPNRWKACSPRAGTGRAWGWNSRNRMRDATRSS